MNGPPCWICEKPLALTVERGGRVSASCPRCRPEIEALQAEVEQLRLKVVRRLCRTCRKVPIRGKGVSECRPCVLARRAAKAKRMCASCGREPVKGRGVSDCRLCVSARRAARRAKRPMPLCRACHARPVMDIGRRVCAECAVQQSARPPRTCCVCRLTPVSGRGRRVCAPCKQRRALAKSQRLDGRKVKGDRTRRKVEAMYEQHPGWTQQRIARAIGVSTTRVSQVIKGWNRPNSDGRKVAA